MESSAPADPHADTSIESMFQDRRTGWAIALLIGLALLLTNLPFILGWWLTPPDFVFSGTAFNFEDINSYLAKMLVGHDGAWIYTNHYTTEPQGPALLFMFYVTLGHIARILHLPLIIAYHLARAGFGLWLLFAIDRLLRVMGLKGAARAFSFALITLASGIGAFTLALSLDKDPAEIWWCEAYVFHSMLLYPHFVAVTLTIVLSLADLYLFGSGRAGWIMLPRLALWATLLAWGHPRLIFNIAAVAGTTAALGCYFRFWKPWRWGAGLALQIACWAVPAMIIVHSYKGDAAWEEWAATDSPSPAGLRYFATYGMLWIFAALGLLKAIRIKSPWVVFVVSWAILGAAIPQLPLAGFRRLIQGANIPLAILSGWYIGEFTLPWLRSRLSARAACYALIPLFVLFFYSTCWSLRMGMDPIFRVRYPWYLGTARYEALHWMRENLPLDDAILSSYDSGIVIPAIAGNRVFAGHWAESLHKIQKLQITKDYFNGKMSPEQMDALYRKHRIKYLFMSSTERRVGPFNPAQADPARWEPIYIRGGIAIYRNTLTPPVEAQSP